MARTKNLPRYEEHFDKRELLALIRPTEVWVAVVEHRRGYNVWAARTEEELRAKLGRNDELGRPTAIGSYRIHGGLKRSTKAVWIAVADGGRVMVARDLDTRFFHKKPGEEKMTLDVHSL